MRLPHWFGEPVHTYDTTLDRLPLLVPTFERRSLPRNCFSDVIVRPTTGCAEPLTVGMVSKSYVLVQHEEAIRAVSEELKRADIEPAKVPVRMELSEYGTRMALLAVLPDAFAFDADDGHRMALTFECLNSVDRTVPLFAAVGSTASNAAVRQKLRVSVSDGSNNGKRVGSRVSDGFHRDGSIERGKLASHLRREP